MKLIELHPSFARVSTPEQFIGHRTHFTFDCPKCQQHKISIPIVGDNKWDIEPVSFLEGGVDFENITLSPSIAHNNGLGCESHFFIRKGEIIDA